MGICRSRLNTEGISSTFSMLYSLPSIFIQPGRACTECPISLAIVAACCNMAPRTHNSYELQIPKRWPLPPSVIKLQTFERITVRPLRVGR